MYNLRCFTHKKDQSLACNAYPAAPEHEKYQMKANCNAKQGLKKGTQY